MRAGNPDGHGKKLMAVKLKGVKKYINSHGLQVILLFLYP
jgi:hypothetical protein